MRRVFIRRWWRGALPRQAVPRRSATNLRLRLKTSLVIPNSFLAMMFVPLLAGLMINHSCACFPGKSFNPVSTPKHLEAAAFFFDKKLFTMRTLMQGH